MILQTPFLQQNEKIYEQKDALVQLEFRLKDNQTPNIQPK